MGLSLGLQSNGTHVAYAAGTGILPFIDIIGHLILSLAAPDLLEDSPNRLGDDFKLVLYTCSHTEDEAIGL